jgi:heat shock protein HslJ
MNTPEDPRIWQGLRTHLDELGSVAAVPPIGIIYDRRRSRRPFRAIAGLAGAGAIVVGIGLLLPSLLAVTAPITGAPPPASPARVTPDASPTAGPVDWAELIGHTYVATDIAERGQPIAIVADTWIGLRFSDASRFTASGGCNQMAGEYQIRDGRLTTAKLYGTLIACPGERGQQDGRFAMFLRSSPTITRNTTGLVLSTGEVVITLVDEALT